MCLALLCLQRGNVLTQTMPWLSQGNVNKGIIQLMFIHFIHSMYTQFIVYCQFYVSQSFNFPVKLCKRKWAEKGSVALSRIILVLKLLVIIMCTSHMQKSTIILYTVIQFMLDFNSDLEVCVYSTYWKPNINYR